ncbi:LuxR family maltose regulon positive regulatory protein [Salinibacterium sp. CAN_S4]|uniref:helix-turn-helix transcriptional regulator n=1 Tax=Salinibacterium sp. CAN_S4 TaxID=2787727 RepID=UPI0018F02C8B
MPRPLHLGIPSVGTIAATGFSPPEQSTRVTILHSVPLVPVRDIVAAALAEDRDDRDILWVDLAQGTGPWESLRSTVATAFGAAVSGDPFDAIAAFTPTLTRPLLLAVDLHPGVNTTVDSGLLDLLATSPLLSIVAVCTGRRALMARARLEFGAVTVPPSALVVDAPGIRAAAAEVGLSLSHAAAAGLAQSALAQADVLPAALAMMEPDAEADADPDTNAIRLRAEISYVLELRATAMSDEQLESAASIAVPATVSTRMLADITGLDVGDRELQRLTQSRVLLRDGQLHLEPTLRRAVLDEARSRIPRTLARLHGAAARHHLATGRAFDALSHFAQAEDWTALVGTIDRSLVDLMAEDQQALHRIILELPRAVRDEHPRLSLYVESEWKRSEPDAPPYLAISRRMPATLSRLPDVMAPWDRLVALLTRALLLRLKSDYSGALETADELDELLETDEMIDRPPLMVAEAHFQAGMCRLLGLDLAGARESFHRSADVARGLDTAAYQSSSRATAALALTRALEGEIEQASALLLALDAMVDTSTLVAHALVDISRMDPAGARHWIAQLGELRDGDEFWAFAVHAENRYGLYWGDPVETDSDLDRAWAEHGDQLVSGSTAQVLLTSDAADLALLLGQLPRAESALEQATVRNTWISVCRARLALLSGNPKHALLFILEGQGRGRTERHGQLDLAVLRAASEHALDREEDATASLLRAINQSNKSGVIVPFHLLPLETLSSLASLHPDAEAFVARHALRGTSYLAPYQTLAGALSERELVVLRALDPGATIEQVARKLFVANNTVKAQLRSIYRKLNVSTRTEALLVAAELGLLDEDPRSA